MNHSRITLCFSAFLAVFSFLFDIGISCSESVFANEPLLTHGLFSEESVETIARDWGVNGSSTTVLSDSALGPVLRLTVLQPRSHVMVYRRLYLPSPVPAALKIQLKVRYDNIQTGAQNWNDGRFIMNFKSSDGKTVSPSPHVPTFRGTSDGWQDVEFLAAVPQGVQYVEMMPYFLQAQSGTLEFASIQVFRSSELPQVKKKAAPKIVKPIPSVNMTPRNIAGLSKPLHVEGNRVVDSDNRDVWLQGVCIDSLEWTASGEKILESVPYAFDVWKANVVRLPVTDEFWFGRNKWQHDGGAGYRKLVDQVVELCAQRKAYLVLDLHRFGIPKIEHREFWADAAVRYKNHPAVLFELFNEPHDISWPVWRDGQDEKGVGQGVGMQTLVNTVREAGANNPVIVGGLDWGYDLTGVASGEFALKDSRTGQGIVYSSHVYPWKRNWSKNFLAAAEKYPLFIGETGNIRSWDDFSFIPESARTEKVGVGSPWPTDMIAVIQKYRLNWTGFSFHPTCGPQMIEDWNYTPTAFWGVYVKQALSGKRFDNAYDDNDSLR